jgi:pseudouridine kinase
VAEQLFIAVKSLYNRGVLTEREQQIVELLRRDPLMSPSLLAAALNTTRTSINVHLSNLGKKGVILGRGYVLAERPGAVVIGGANIDMKAQSSARASEHTSNPGHASMAPGGVGRNIAENLARLGDRVHLVSMVGRDSLGMGLLEHTSAAGVRIEHVVRTDRATGTYTVVLDATGEMLVAISDMDAMSDLGPEQIQPARDVITNAGVLVLDGNLRRDAFEYGLDLSPGVRAIVEPVSVPKAAALKDCLDDRVFAITPDRDELSALTDLPTRTDRQVRTAARALHDRGLDVVWVTLGKRGSLLSTPEDFTEIPAVPTTVTDVTGAGDSMVAAFCHVLLAGGTPLEAARLGHAAAAVTIASPHTVRPDLTLRLLEAAADQKEPS